MGSSTAVSVTGAAAVLRARRRRAGGSAAATGSVTGSVTGSAAGVVSVRAPTASADVPCGNGVRSGGGGLGGAAGPLARGRRLGRCRVSRRPRRRQSSRGGCQVEVPEGLSGAASAAGGPAGRVAARRRVRGRAVGAASAWGAVFSSSSVMRSLLSARCAAHTREVRGAARAVVSSPRRGRHDGSRLYACTIARAPTTEARRRGTRQTPSTPRSAVNGSATEPSSSSSGPCASRVIRGDDGGARWACDRRADRTSSGRTAGVVCRTTR